MWLNKNMTLKQKLVLLSVLGISVNIIALLLVPLIRVNNPLLYVLLILIIFVFILSAYLLAINQIFKSFNYIIEVSSAIANGNLNVKLEKKYLGRDDEIGLISRAFYFMLLKIRQILNSLEIKVKDRTAQLAKTKATDEAMLSSIADAVIAIDNFGKIIYINNRAETMFNWDKSKIIGENILNVWNLKKDKNRNLSIENHPVSLALKGNKIYIEMKDNYWCVVDNNYMFPVNITVSPIILDNTTIGAISLTRDISEAKEIDKAKTEFVSLTSHQLRTPLSAINWFVEMLNSGETGGLNEIQKNYLEIIRKTSKRMTELVNSLLNVARIELGNFAVEPQLTDINLLAEISVEELRPLLIGKNLNLELDIDRSVPKIFVDVKLTSMIFQNLITNAIKYSYADGKIILSVKNGEHEIIISVNDNGIGIPKSNSGKIFTKFYRADNTAKIKTEGTGLGLYIIKNILEQTGGKIWFISEENEGSTFSVAIPYSGMKKREGQKKLS